MRRVLAIATVAVGAAVCAFAGYKAGQRNGVPVLGGGAAPKALPSGTGAVLTQTGATELEQDALKAAIDAALLG